MQTQTSMPVTADKSRVLVVDDEPQITRVLRTVLTSHGYQVRTVYTRRRLRSSTTVPASRLRRASRCSNASSASPAVIRPTPGARAASVWACRLPAASSRRKRDESGLRVPHPAAVPRS